MSTVAHITPHLFNVEAPAAIRDTPAWVIWRFEDNPNGSKPRKVPYYANGNKRAGEQGAPKDVASLVTFDAAKAAAARRGFDGVGFATLPQFGICALDFDDCIIEGKVHPDIEPLVLSTYAEFSPSGKGIRLFFKGDLGNGKAIKREPYGMECFSSRGFVTFTGNVLDIVELMGNADTVSMMTPEARELQAKRFEKPRAQAEELPPSAIEPVGMGEEQIAEMLTKLDPNMHHDDWLHVGMGLHHECQGHDVGFDYWNAWSANGGSYPGEDELRKRWDTFGRHNDRTVTIRTAMKMAGMNLAGPASADEFEAIIDAQAASTDSTPMKFMVVPAHEFANATPQPWRIKGVLPDAELVVMYGASGSGKSFVALDMGAAIARGVDWRGRKVKQGRVAYIAAEGAGGFRKRLTAYAQVNGIDLAGLAFGVIRAAPNMMERTDAAAVANAVRAWGGADIIIVDTFAQVMPGANENSGDDVGKALAHCKRIHEATGATILLIHHAGKDATKGARGWSGLRAAADAEIEVVREAVGRALRLTKSKDGEDGLMWGFDLDIVQIGLDEDLEPITSCVVVEAELPVVGGVATRVLGKNERIVNEVIQEIALSQNSGIEVKFVLDEAAKRMPPNEKGKRDTRRQKAKQALEKLCNGDDAPYYLDVSDNTIEIL